MIGILFSTEEEAHPFLKIYERGRFNGLDEGDEQHDDKCLVAVVGIGKIKATLRTERLARRHSLQKIVNVGTCTSLVDSLPIGKIVAATQVFEGDRIELAAPTYPRMPLANPFPGIDGVTLVTQDHTVHGATELSYWQRIADVSDMTGYAVAYVAATHGIGCNVLKVVSGHMGVEDKDVRKTIRSSNKKVCEYLAKNLGSVL
jgi:nucleoside phosphorylase